jgi:cytochrome c oxidase subunit 4
MSTANHDEHAHLDDGAVHAHISGFGFLVGIFAALIVCTVLTVAVSYVDLGSANLVVAVIIATIKASLVSVFFMHLRHDKPFHSVIFVAAFVFLGVFLLYTTNDLNTRGDVDLNSGGHVYARTGAAAPGGIVVPPPPSPAELAHHIEEVEHEAHH